MMTSESGLVIFFFLHSEIEMFYGKYKLPRVAHFGNDFDNLCRSNVSKGLLIDQLK